MYITQTTMEIMKHVRREQDIFEDCVDGETLMSANGGGWSCCRQEEYDVLQKLSVFISCCASSLLSVARVASVYRQSEDKSSACGLLSGLSS